MSVAALEAAPKKGLSVSVLTLLLVSFVGLLFAGQIAVGTIPLFALLVSSFIFLGAWTIKVLGGPFTLAGASVLVLMGQHIVISQVAKTFYLQSASAPLLHPIETILVYNLAMVGILAAAYCYRLVRVEKFRPVFGLETDIKTLGIMTALFTIFTVVRFVILQRFGYTDNSGVYVGGIVGPLRQFGFISPLAVACGTAYVILKSNGKRCVGGWNALAILSITSIGILGAGRADSASAVVTFIMTLIAFKFKLRTQHYVFAIVAAYIFQGILFPYSLYARGEGTVREGSLETRIQKSMNLVVDVALNPDKYKEKESKIDPSLRWDFQRIYYYGKPLATLDRYSVIISTDSIIHSVLQRGAAGWDNALAGFKMVLPRFLNPEKEALGSSNNLARYGEGLVGDTDFMTQITLGIIPEGFYSMKWMGVFIATFVVSFFYFTIYRLLLYQNLSRNVFALSQVFVVTWTFSESTMQGQTLNILQTPIYFIAAVYPVVLFAKSMAKKNREAPFVYNTAVRDDIIESSGEDTDKQT